MNLEAQPWIADFRNSAAHDIFFSCRFPGLRGGVLHFFLFIFRVFGWFGIFPLGTFQRFLILFLGRIGGGVCVLRPAEPLCSVSGLVWVVRPLICGTGHVFGVLVWVQVAYYGAFRVIFLFRPADSPRLGNRGRSG